MTFTFRRLAFTSAALAVAALLPIACSSKAPVTEPVIKGCSSDSDCQTGHCENGLCRPDCSVSANDCPTGQTCTSGRCMGGGGGTSGTGSGGSSGSGTAGSIIIPDAGDDATDDGSLDPDAACGTGSATASLVPVSMFVMFDRSGSMIQNMSTRWANASAALTAFFQDPGAADLAVALRFFPHDQPALGCTNNATTGCVVADCAQPLVPLMADPMVALPKLTADPAPTDTLEQTLVDAITASVPMSGNMSGGTPTSAALDGAITWATAYQAAHPPPEQQTVVVFVTDGEPNGCDENLMNIQAIASTALATSMIKTYVVGLTDDPDSLAFLDDLAVAGGTDAAFIVQDGATAAAGLVAALKAIQGSSLACNFPYPATTDGGMANPTLINVNYTPGTPGAMTVPFFRVDNEAACGTEAGWYYDNPTAPTQIFLCPASCDTVKADTNAKLDIQIGCTSRPPPEH